MENGVPHVGAYVCCSSDGEDSWKCKATCIFRVVNTVADDVAISKPASGYIKNNTFIIECNITAFMSSLSEVAHGACGTKRRCTDVKLLVRGRELYANKGVLAASCDYFEALFYGDFNDRNKDEIELDDVNQEDLVSFLKVIKSSVRFHRRQVLVVLVGAPKNNLIAVLRLADRFGAKLLLERCDQFIVDEMNLKDAIIALDDCGLLSDLKVQLLDKIGKRDLKSLSEEEAYKQLSKETALLVVKELRRHAFP
ncbi:BTB/POZ domain-containing protein [Aphelenchoides avenae]|nr:BTB/POZ domain-containing protein [Aphelenchus avenae]